MPRTRPPYPPEFRAEAVKLARSSEKPLSELARDLGEYRPEPCATGSNNSR